MLGQGEKVHRAKTYSPVGSVGGDRELLVRVVVLVQEICKTHQGTTARSSISNTVSQASIEKRTPIPAEANPPNPPKREGGAPTSGLLPDL
jgi:hypothetical protein